jgi:hypothetical protein
MGCCMGAARWEKEVLGAPLNPDASLRKSSRSPGSDPEAPPGMGAREGEEDMSVAVIVVIGRPGMPREAGEGAASDDSCGGAGRLCCCWSLATAFSNSRKLRSVWLRASSGLLISLQSHRSSSSRRRSSMSFWPPRCSACLGGGAMPFSRMSSGNSALSYAWHPAVDGDVR